MSPVSRFTASRFTLIASLAALFLTSGILLTLRSARAEDPKPTQLAVVNIVKVFASLNEKLDGDKEIEELGKKINDERRKREDDIQKLTDALKNPMFSANSPELKKMQDDLLDATVDYQAFLGKSETRLLMMQRIKTAGIYRSINAAVEKYSKAKGIAMVFVYDDIDLNAKDMRELTSKIAMRKILYVHPNFDITNQIIESMNADYRLGSNK